MISFKKVFLFIFNRDFRNFVLSYSRALRDAAWRKDYKKAINECETILENNCYEPMKSNVYECLGEIYLWDGNILEAEKNLRIALELKMKNKGHDAYLYKLLGDISIKTGKYKDALMFYEKTVQFGSKGIVNKHLINMDNVLKMKALLEEDKEMHPFLTAYFEQNKDRFLNTTENDSD
jgi:tetratricopeptide (TPR) repeat protein